MSDPVGSRRNFGPEIGCDLIVWGDRVTPRCLEQPLLYLVALVGLVIARRNIAHSRDYLAAVTGRPASLLQVWRHYQRMIVGLAKKLRAANGNPPAFRTADMPESAPFVALAGSAEPAFFGTFHVGDSDLLGCMLAERFSRRVSMVRLRVGNSADTERLARRYGAGMDFIWVNKPEELLFGVKNAVASGASLALQCDREEHASKTGVFRFLGAKRRFPTTIYHLAALFRRPVAFAFAFPDPADDMRVVVYPSAVFRPEPGASREAVLAAGEAHFQGVLDLLEALLRRQPDQWFNFIPLNSVVEPG